MNRLILALTFLIPFAACGDDAEKSKWDFTETCTSNCPDPNPNPNPTPNPQTSPVLNSEFVSGHLGNYASCPDEGYSPDPSAGEQGGAFAGDCAEDNCGSLNCDTAQITFTITNSGQVEGLGLEIDTIELYDNDGTLVAELPVMEVLEMDVEARAPMSSIAPETDKLFMVTFQGPAEPWSLLSSDSERGYGYSGTVVIRFKSSNHPDFLLKSPLVYVLDNIAT